MRPIAAVPFLRVFALGVLLSAFILLPGAALASNGTHVPTTTYTQNTTWTTLGSPYVLDGNVTVASGVTLTINPGVVVKLNGQLRELVVNGTLSAVGAQGNEIVFTSVKDDTVGGDSNGDGSATSPAAGNWYRIRIAAGTASELRYVKVRYGGWGSANASYGAVWADGSSTQLTVANAEITLNQRSGIYVQTGGGVTVSASTISSNGNGISANQGWVKVKARTFLTNNAADGLYFSYTSTYSGTTSSIFDSDVSGNPNRGIYIQASGLAASKYPYGSRNNIYANGGASPAGKQLDTTARRWDVDWTGNYWGSDAYFWKAAGVCQGVTDETYGHIGYRWSNPPPGGGGIPTPPDGPIAHANYVAGSGQNVANCPRDDYRIWPIEFSPYYLGGAQPALAPGQALTCLRSFLLRPRLTECTSDPVNSATGNFAHAVTDISLPGIGVTFDFVRSYNSLDTTSGTLGLGWTHNHAAALTVKASGDISLRDGDGQRFEYAVQQDGSFAPPPGALATLASVTGGYELTRPDQVKYRFDANGRFTSIKDRNNQGLTYAYDGSGRLSTITDAVGRVINLTYDGNGRLAQVAVPDGRAVTFAYTSGRLTSVTDVRGKVWTYAYEAKALLEKETDPLSHVVVRNVYSTDGRVAEQYDALNNKTTFAWDYQTQTQTTTDARNNTWKDVYVANVLDKRIDALNHQTVYGRNASLDETSVTGPDGTVVSMTYDAKGNMLSASAPSLAATKTVAYDAQNNVTSVTDALGKVTTYAYDGSGNNTSVSQAAQALVQYAYSGQGQLSNSTDGRGSLTTYTYDASGNRASETDSLGNKTSYSYDSAGRIVSRVDPLGNVQGADPNLHKWTYTYNAAGSLLMEADPLDNTTTSTYDDVGNPTSVTDAQNRTTSYSYDAANRVSSITAPGGAVTQYTYDAVGNTLTERDARNNTTTFGYDANNRLTSATTPLGNKTTYFYDANGNLIKQVDPRGNVQGANPDDYATTHTYDVAGRMLTTTDPLGNVTAYTYDKVGNQTSVRDANLRLRTLAYNGLNWLTSETSPDTGITSYTYDGIGNVLTRTDQRGKVTTYGYDAAGRLTSATTPLGNKATFFYDANGRRTKVVEARGNVQGANPDDYATTYTYDRAGRRLTEADPLGNTTTYTYDTLGNRTSVKDAKNRTTSYAYDAADRLSSVTVPSGAVTSYAYDLVGNLLTRTDPNNHTTTYALDADNRTATMTLPLSRQWTYVYDAAGNTTQVVDANGDATPTAGDGTSSYTYNRSGRLTTIDYSDSTPDVSFGYDAVGNRTSMTDGQGSQTYVYDSVNRLSGVTRGADTFAYLYDVAGNITRRTYPDSTVVDYAYDDDARLQSATSAPQTTVYTYDAASNLTQTTLPAANGYVEQRTYDRAGRLTRVKSVNGAYVLADFSYTLDATSNPTQLVRAGSLPGTTTYAYDVRDRLIEVCFQTSCPGGSDPFIRWTYDAVDNRLTETRPTGTTSYTYNAADQLTQAGSTSYTYDQNGNELSAGSRTFTYDLANRLASATSGGTTTSYSYDGDGNRLQSAGGGQVMKFLWDTSHDLPQLALERDGAGSLLRRYLYGQRRISLSTPSTTSYYHYDNLGSVANLTSSGGTTQWTYEYEPFGSTRTETQNDPAAPPNPLKFTGELLDPTGLYYLHAREYDPAPGRFLQIDPVPPDLRAPYGSPYSYVGNRPTALVDPSGQRGQPSSDGLVGMNIASGRGRCNLPSGDVECELGDFTAASWNDRTAWTTSINRRYGLEGWFNVFGGILEYFRGSQVWAESGGMRFADGAVLWTTSLGLRKVVARGGGGPWVPFFQAVIIGRNREAPILKRLWGTAEQRGVDFAADLSESRISDEEQFYWDVFKFLGDDYRAGVRSNRAAGCGTSTLFKFCTSYDPRRDAGAVKKWSFIAESVIRRLP